MTLNKKQKPANLMIFRLLLLGLTAVIIIFILLITILAVSLQSYKATIQNPSETLGAEELW